MGAVQDSIRLPDESRNTALAGQTVNDRGFNITYDENGYVETIQNAAHPIFSGRSESEYAPSKEAVLSSISSDSYRPSLNSGHSDAANYLSDGEIQRFNEMWNRVQNGQLSQKEYVTDLKNSLARYGVDEGGRRIYNGTTTGTNTGNNTSAQNLQSSQGYDYNSLLNQINELQRQLSQQSTASQTAYQKQLAEQQAQSEALVKQLQAQYDAVQGQYAQALADQKAAQEAAVRQAVNGLEGQKQDVNTSYSDLYRQAYVDKMNAKKNIDQRLAAQGVTGGAAESTLLGLDTAYSDALRRAEQERIGTLGDIDRAITDTQLTGDIEGARAAAETARESAKDYAETLKSLVKRQDALASQQLAAAREEAEAARKTAAEERDYAYKTAMRLLEGGYLPGGELLHSAGIDSASAEAIVARVRAEAEREEQARKRPLLTVAQVNDAIKNGILTAEVLAAYEYYYGEPYRG